VAGSKRQRRELPSPGPASYGGPKDSLQSGVKISKSRRRWDYLGHGFASCVPGPGSYALPQMKPTPIKKPPIPVIPRKISR